MTNEEIRSFFYDRVDAFEIDGKIDVEAMIRVFSVEFPEETVESLGESFDRVRYLATEVSEQFRLGWRKA